MVTLDWHILVDKNSKLILVDFGCNSIVGKQHKARNMFGFYSGKDHEAWKARSEI
jgi:hypothetical protein